MIKTEDIWRLSFSDDDFAVITHYKNRQLFLDFRGELDQELLEITVGVPIDLIEEFASPIKLGELKDLLYNLPPESFTVRDSWLKVKQSCSGCGITREIFRKRGFVGGSNLCVRCLDSEDFK